MAGLKRTLGLAECIFFGVGSILGAGIYTLIGKVAGLSGNFIWLSFGIAAITALFTAFSYAELSAAFPTAGGEYEYAKRAFGKRTGVFLGMIISLNGIISGATVSVGFAGYLAGLTGIAMLAGALGIIGLVFAINASGIRESSVVNIIFTLIEAGGLFFVIYAAFPSIGQVDYMELPPGGVNSILAASALAFFAYIGFEDIVKLAEETTTPEKNIPRALLISSAIVIVVYSLVAVCAGSDLMHPMGALVVGAVAGGAGDGGPGDGLSRASRLHGLVREERHAGAGAQHAGRPVGGARLPAHRDPKAAFRDQRPELAR